MPPDFEATANKAFRAIKRSVLRTQIIYNPKAGGSFTFNGIFDDRAQEVDPDTEQPVSSNVFTLGIQLSDLPQAPEKGDRVTIKTQTYRVVDFLKDGVPDVSTVLVLHKVGA